MTRVAIVIGRAIGMTFCAFWYAAGALLALRWLAPLLFALPPIVLMSQPNDLARRDWVRPLSDVVQCARLPELTKDGRVVYICSDGKLRVSE